MTTSQPPLDEQERDLARVVRALPAAEPSAALDARILKIANNAVASSSKRRFGWWGSAGAAWGIGSAAAAVLAIGVSWQMMNPPPIPLPAQPASAVITADNAEPGVPVEFKEEQLRKDNNFSPPVIAAEQEAKAERQTQPQQTKTLARALESPAPAPPAIPQAPSPFLDEHVHDEPEVNATAEAGTALSQAAPITAANQNASDAISRGTIAAPSSEPISVAAAAAKASMPALEGDNYANSNKRVEAQASDRDTIADDAKLSPNIWFEKIRARMQAKDLSGARASLLLYLEQHPRSDVTIPDDLKPLLHE